MKSFSYNGRVLGQTMTVGELRKSLEEYPDDLPVLAEWESCMVYVSNMNFMVNAVTKGDDKCECLVIDVNLY